MAFTNAIHWHTKCSIVSASSPYDLYSPVSAPPTRYMCACRLKCPVRTPIVNPIICVVLSHSRFPHRAFVRYLYGCVSLHISLDFVMSLLHISDHTICQSRFESNVILDFTVSHSISRFADWLSEALHGLRDRLYLRLYDSVVVPKIVV